jgi:acetamidase/formamidase
MGPHSVHQIAADRTPHGVGQLDRAGALGGNLDIKHLAGRHAAAAAGRRGRRAVLGRRHPCRDGRREVCGTVVEASMDIAVRLEVRRDVSIAAPQFVVAAGELARTEAGGYHVCTGVAPDLMEATRAATRAAIPHITDRRGGTAQEAYALASVALRPAHP